MQNVVHVTIFHHASARANPFREWGTSILASQCEVFPARSDGPALGKFPQLRDEQIARGD